MNPPTLTPSHAPLRASTLTPPRALENFALIACDLPLPLYRAPSCSIVHASDPCVSVLIRSGNCGCSVHCFRSSRQRWSLWILLVRRKRMLRYRKVSTMTKIIKEMLPPDVRVARDTQDLLIECCVEFINLVSSESNEVCSREDKRTIAPEHVLKALEVLGFGDYIEDVYAAYEQHKVETADTVKGGKCTNGAEMTEEEALAEQQRMFAEARARMNGVATATTTTTAPKPPDAEPSLNC
uniref:Putative histone-fold protein n=1 Tax=Helianthus annuus TaxID=4232 RepID=A0A251U0C0_HELAN